MRVKYGVTLRLSGYPLYTFDYNYYFKFFVSTGIYRRHENYPHTRRCFNDDCH